MSKREKLVKVRHTAQCCASNTPEGVAYAYQSCLNQIVGYFFSNDVVIENSMAAPLDRGVLVIMTGYLLFKEEELAKIRKADAEYHAAKAKET